MKNKIFLYLFIFAVLYIIFQYTNAQKTFEMQMEKIEELETENTALENKIKTLTTQKEDLTSFELLHNAKASSYFEDRNLPAKEVSQKVEAAIISKNKPDEDNELVPYQGLEGNFNINSVRILNHKWAIAEFTDGTYWGEVLIKYFVEENGQISFETGDAFLYANPEY